MQHPPLNTNCVLVTPKNEYELSSSQTILNLCKALQPWVNDMKGCVVATVHTAWNAKTWEGTLTVMINSKLYCIASTGMRICEYYYT